MIFPQTLLLDHIKDYHEDYYTVNIAPNYINVFLKVSSFFLIIYSSYKTIKSKKQKELLFIWEIIEFKTAKETLDNRCTSILICFSILIKREATKCKNHDNNNPFILSFVKVFYVSVYNGRLHFTIIITNLYNDDKGFQIYISV